MIQRYRDRNLILILLLISLVLSSCKAPSSPRLRPGDKIGNTLLTTGASSAVPLGYLCIPEKGTNGVMIETCDVKPHTRLAIGFAFGVPERTLAHLDWSASEWVLSIDQQPLDLAAFGTYDQIQPTILSSPSRIRNVMIKVTAWDVVLENLVPGSHTLSGHVRTKAKTYRWMINIHFE